MRKSGLQKQISSIFSDVPAPQADASDMELPQAASSEADSTTESSQTQQQQQQSEIAEQIESVHTPAVSTMRPKPLHRTQTDNLKQTSEQTIINQIKKVMAGKGNGKIDARQKKLTVLVGFLSVTFVSVLVISLGGLGQKKNAPAEQTTAQAQTQQANAPTVNEWQMPDLLPANLRDPAQTVVAGTKPTDPVNNTEAGGQVTLRGIVFSKDNPSAIVNGKYVSQGDSVNGVTIVTINKDSVEFEKDGKRWTQQVQH